MGAGGDRIDLNADVGEGVGDDVALFASGITSANVACGAHAGDEATMRRACELAAVHDVALGAHPGFADREHFGRREQDIDSRGLKGLVVPQLESLRRLAGAAGLPLRHVKPHGALYHVLNRDRALAGRFVAIVREVLPGARIFGPPEGELRGAAERSGSGFVAEGFIDRAYLPNGSLVPRGERGAVLHDEATVVAQALSLARVGRCRTLCVHGDGPAAVRLLTAARDALLRGRFTISAPV